MAALAVMGFLYAAARPGAAEGALAQGILPVRHGSIASGSLLLRRAALSYPIRSKRPRGSAHHFLEKRRISVYNGYCWIRVSQKVDMS